VVTDYTRYFSKRPRRQCMGLLRFPSLASVPAFYFAQSATTASMLLILHDTSVGWKIGGGVSLAGIVGACFASMGYFALHMRSEYVNIQQRTGRSPPLARFLFFGDGMWVDSERHEQTHHTQMMVVLFDGLRGSRAWFACVELVSAVVFGWIGAHLDPEDCVLSTACAFVASMGYLVAVISLRPFAAPVDILCMILLAAAQTGATASFLAHRVWPEAAGAGGLARVGGVIAVGCLYFVAAKGILEMCAVLTSCLYSRMLKQAERKQRVESSGDTAQLDSALGAGADPWLDEPVSTVSHDAVSDGYLSDALAAIERKRSPQRRARNPLARDASKAADDSYSRLVALL